ncbi:MAG: GNAT family N-acetyltransferase [Limnochordia bacterium]
MEIICRPLAQSEFELALAVRMKVFVEEQKVPVEEEHDHLDAEAVHFGAFSDGEIIGTGRIVPRGTVAKVGRVAVLPQYRGMRVGYRLMEAMLEWAGKRGFTEAILGAQLQAIGFYERLGFVPEGDVFDDAGIPHRQMRRALT